MCFLISPSRVLILCIGFLIAGNANAAALLAGAAKVDITDESGPINDRLFARALVLKSGDTTAVLVTICLLYTSPSPRDRTRSRMPSSA